MALKPGAKADYSRRHRMLAVRKRPRPPPKKPDEPGGVLTATNAELQQRKNAATPRGVGVMCDFYAERALNAELWDIEGRRFIDFAAGIAVTNTGHRHPKIVAALREQLDHFTHTAYQIVPY